MFKITITPDDGVELVYGLFDNDLDGLKSYLENKLREK